MSRHTVASPDIGNHIPEWQFDGENWPFLGGYLSTGSTAMQAPPHLGRQPSQPSKIYPGIHPSLPTMTIPNQPDSVLHNAYIIRHNNPSTIHQQEFWSLNWYWLQVWDLELPLGSGPGCFSSISPQRIQEKGPMNHPSSWMLPILLSVSSSSPYCNQLLFRHQHQESSMIPRGSRGNLQVSFLYFGLITCKFLVNFP